MLCSFLEACASQIFVVSVVFISNIKTGNTLIPLSVTRCTALRCPRHLMARKRGIHDSRPSSIIYCAIHGGNYIRHCIRSSLPQPSLLLRWMCQSATYPQAMQNANAYAIQKPLTDECKGKGIRFRVLYPPKRSHDLPPLAGTVHTETISIPRGIFQSNWQHILFMLGTHFAAG